MKVKRYFASNAREALAMVRAELGTDAVVLKNRPVPGGVEILAMADGDVPREAPEVPVPPDGQPASSAQPSSDAQDTPMSTVSFESYVRERQQRRVAAAGAVHCTVSMLANEEHSLERILADDLGESFDGFAEATLGASAPASTRSGHGVVCAGRRLPDGMLREAPLENRSSAAIARPDASAHDSVDAQVLIEELREMRGAISDRLETMTWFEGVRRRPAQSRLLRRLLQAGFSASLSRTLVHHLPADFGDDEADRWLHEALVRNLRVDSPERTIFDEGGTYALLGPTGVGKTTTAAKIAAQFALKHGAQSVGLITADVYRIGAQDQLRTFGRLLGVPVHVAHDVTTLADFLQLYMNKKLVLIDTAGVAQRDERVGELLCALASAQVRKVLVVNAASQAEAIEETIGAYQGRSAAGVVLSKVDEAVRLGGALDCLIRHRLTLQGVANGQRVPEDWHRPEPRMLVDHALATPDTQASTAFAFEEAELAMLLSADQRSAPARVAEAVRV